jgi:hypothetical protein
MNRKTPRGLLDKILLFLGVQICMADHYARYHCTSVLRTCCANFEYMHLPIEEYPPWRRVGDMERGTGNNTGVLVSPATAVTRFRKPLVDYLISGLEVNDKWVRILAADMLGSVGDPRAVEHLKPLLVDSDRDLRLISAQAMDMIRSGQAALSRSQPDPCACCMIRLIAEEALTQQKPRG